MTNRGRRVLVIEPQSSGNSLVTAARDLDLEVFIASHNEDDRRLDATTASLADTLLKVDTNDEDALAEAVRSMHAGRPISGVIPGCEYYVDAAARVASQLGLPGLAPQTARQIRDKSLMLDRVADVGLRVPRYAVITDSNDIDQAIEGIGFPAVLKPTENSGSIHVSRVDGRTQLADAWHELQQDQRLIFGRQYGTHALLTEYISGPEFSVEGYVLDGDIVICAVTEKLLGPEPYFTELGHIVQAEIEPDTRELLEKYVQAVVAAVGIHLGPFHCEVRLSSNGPVLMEIAGRLPGGRISDMVEMVTGVSLPKITVGAHCALPDTAALAIAARSYPYAGIYFFTAPGLRAYKQVDGWEDFRSKPGVIEACLTVHPGQVIPEGNDRRCRIGYVLFAASSYLAAREWWHDAATSVRFS